MLLRFIGSLEHSAAAQAAYAIGGTQLFSLVTWPSLGLMAAASVVASQNVGAGRPDRSVAGVTIACGFGAAIAAMVAALFLAVPQTLIGAFGVDDARVLTIGTQLLRHLSVSAVPFTVGLICMGGLQGGGDTRTPLLIALVSQIALPVICGLAARFGSLTPVDVWRAIVLAHALRCALAIWSFRRGRWRTAPAYALASA
jgi:Na+-driven multidrug efflux pump